MVNTPLQDIQELQLDVGIFDAFLHNDAATEVDFSAAQDGSDMRPSLAMFVANLGCHPAAGGSVAAVQTGVTGASTYNNGAAGVGATLTANANGAFSAAVIDGVAPVVAMRVWITATAGLPHAGIYTFTQIGDAGTPWILTRATDADSPGELGYLFAYAKGGATLQGNAVLFPVSAAGLVVGTTPLPTVTVSGSLAVGAETARAEAAEAAIENGQSSMSALQAANFALAATAKTWIVDDTGGNIVATVPAGAGFPNQEWIVLKAKNSANTVTVTMTGAELLNGAPTFVLHNQYDKVHIQNRAGGTTWYII